MLLTIITATLVVSLISWLGILFFWKKKFTNKFTKAGISLAAGALLGAVFLNIVPELFSEHDVHHHEETSYHTEEIIHHDEEHEDEMVHYEDEHGDEGIIHNDKEHEHSVALLHNEENNEKKQLSNTALSVIILISIILFFLVEKYLHWHHCQCEHEEEHVQKKPLGYINLIGDGLHNFIDGSLIASTFMLDYHLGIVTTIAIILHEIPQELADFTVLVHSGFTKTKALMWNFIFALTAVIGGIITYLFAQFVTQLIPVLLSIAVGSFLYLAMSDIIPELHKENHTKQIFKQLFWLVIGVALIYLGNQLFGHSHG